MLHRRFSLNDIVMDNNPVYRHCPPKVSFPIHFTSFAPQCDVDFQIQLRNGIRNSYDYRMFLQENAQDIMNHNRNVAIQRNAGEPCNVSKVTWSMMDPLKPLTPLGART